MTIDSEKRRQWLAVLAQAPRDALQQQAECIDTESFDMLRDAECGLVMLRARIGNHGDRFNLGEATLTRCVVRHRGAAGETTAGVGYVLGRDAQRAGWVACLDALLQQPDRHDGLMLDVIAPLQAAIDSRRAAQRSRTAASRVQFFTLQPEATS
jgi:alpha-D-ribose 1-methylphosphonate 5-triphosphate synthase subunit PhnG